MALWNPKSTGTLGLEWFPFETGVVQLDGAQKVVGMSLDQTVSHPIDTIAVANSGLPTRGGLYVIEVFDNENGAVTADYSVQEANPNEDVSDGSWINSAGNSTNNYDYINEASTAVNTADYIQMSGALSRYTSRFSTASLTLTGKRIVAVTMRMYVAVGPTGAFAPGWNLGGLDYGGEGWVGWRGPEWHVMTYQYNPFTHRPWTLADIAAFDSTDEWYAIGTTQAGAWAACVIYECALGVFYVDENRLAFGVLDDMNMGLVTGSAAAPAWNSAVMTTPTGATWTKDGSGKHLYVIRRINGVGAMNLPVLDTPSGNSAPIGRGWRPATSALFDYIPPSGMGDANTRMFPMIQHTTTGPADSTDSMPYARTLAANVYTGSDAEQEFSGAAALPYGVIRALVNKTVDTTATLDIKIKRRSDNVQFGTTYNFSTGEYAALDDLGDGWKALRIQLATPGTLAGGTQYYLEFSSTAASSLVGWSIQALDTGGSGNLATYSGTTDNALVNGVDNTRYELAATVATVPTAPTGMTATVTTLSAPDVICCAEAIRYVALTWNATSLAANFSHYDVERTQDAGVTWDKIFYITQEATPAYNDLEAKRNTTTQYRVRTVRTDGSYSAWSTSSSVSLTVAQPTLYLSSNYGNQAYAFDYRPDKEFDFNEDEAKVISPAFMTDYQFGAIPLEVRGTTARFSILIALDDAKPTGMLGGKQAFDRLRTILNSPWPYVCVNDHLGNRYLAMVRAVGGSEEQPEARYVAEVSATEVTATPYRVVTPDDAAEIAPF